VAFDQDVGVFLLEVCQFFVFQDLLSVGSLGLLGLENVELNAQAGDELVL
jgi:hypothetical protein